MNAYRWAAAAAALAMSAAAAEAQGFIGQPKRDRTPQQQTEAPPAKREKVFPTGANWVAISLNGKPFSGERPSLVLDQQFRAKGFGGCNTFSATAYPLREQNFAVGPLAITKRSCDQGRMATERAYFVALRTAAKWEMAGSILVLKSPNGELRFERVL